MNEGMMMKLKHLVEHAKSVRQTKNRVACAEFAARHLEEGKSRRKARQVWLRCVTKSLRQRRARLARTEVSNGSYSVADQTVPECTDCMAA